MTEQDWPAGWTSRERVETVVNERISVDVRVRIEVIADTAGVDVEIAREVIHDMADRGTLIIVERGDTEWISRQPDYSDTRWGEAK